MGTLYVVSTPIGNLGDLSRRATEVLGRVSRILAEDTRRTRPLLTHLGLSTPMVSFHAHNETSKREAILDWLADGEDIAMVSDAGTPLVSDPGERLVDAVLSAGYPVVPIPGPSAILAALVASGLPSDRFTFLGFLPRKGAERRELLDRISTAPETTVLFESPERLLRLLEDLGDTSVPDRRGAVCRELTKLHEEFVRGTLEELKAHFTETPPRGEITLVLEPAGEVPGALEVDSAAAAALAEALLEDGRSPSRAAKEISRRLKIPRNDAYEIVQEVNRTREGGESDSS
jgi:16S rRNA (cytidine1402-2'-O)-methyltransferase